MGERFVLPEPVCAWWAGAVLRQGEQSMLGSCGTSTLPCAKTMRMGRYTYRTNEFFNGAGCIYSGRNLPVSGVVICNAAVALREN